MGAEYEVIDISQYAQYLMPRTKDWHKGKSGHVLVIGGDVGYSGAVRMAGEAALRVGAGLVTIATHPEHANVLNLTRPELMCHGIKVHDDLTILLNRADILIIGPGLGQSSWSKMIWQHVCLANQPKLIDADALNLLAQQPFKCQNWVLTPHPGEAGRLLQCSADVIQQDRFAAIKKIVAAYGGTCVLKGCQSLVLKADATIALCDKGNPGMATAGMGDILSGVIGGLIAQGLPLAVATKVGVYIHALAGDDAAKMGERGMIATDLLPHLRQIVNNIGPSEWNI